MRFSEFHQKLEEIHKKTSDFLVDEDVLSEVLSLKNGHEFKIFLGDELVVKQRDTGVPDWGYSTIYDLRPLYNSRAKEFTELLGSLEAKIAMAGTLNKKLVDALVQPYLKESVLDRLTGNDEMPDNFQVIKIAANKRLLKLNNRIPTGPRSFSEIFKLPSPSEVYGLAVQFWTTSSRILYGEEAEITGLKRAWSLLQNYDKVEAQVMAFVELIRPVWKLCKQAD